MPTPHHSPIAVRRAPCKLGGDLRDARKRRGLTAEIVAQRAFAFPADPSRDQVGQQLAAEALPMRVRLKRAKPADG